MSKPNAILDDFLEDIHRMKKEARVKRAEPISEPGGYMGRSTHPSASTDDNLIEGRTGARAAENTRDVKDNREKPSVDATSEAGKPAGEGTPEQDKRQLNIGLESSSTGADPGVEDDYKGTKDDPGTSHPMKADDGQKYAAYRSMPLAKLAGHFAARRDSILAKLAGGQSTEKQALNIQHANAGSTQRVAAPPAPSVLSPAPAASGAAPAAPGLPTASATKIAAQQAAAQQGYQVAAALGTPDAMLRKRAMAMLEATVKEADLKADLTKLALQQYAYYRQKAAGDPDAMQEGEGHEGKGGPPSPGGDGGAPGGGGPPPAPEVPGDPAGGAPGGAPAGGGPQASPEQTVHELAAALLEMGIDPAELAAAAEQLKAQAGGGMPGGAPGGMPGGAPGGMPGGGDPMAQAKVAQANAWIKAASAVAKYKRDGRFSIGAPKTAELELLRSNLKGHIAELMRYGR